MTKMSFPCLVLPQKPLLNVNLSSISYSYPHQLDHFGKVGQEGSLKFSICRSFCYAFSGSLRESRGTNEKEMSNKKDDHSLIFRIRWQEVREACQNPLGPEAVR